MSAVAQDGQISVVVVSHNYGQYLTRCLQSVLGQSRLPDEVLVVDDASDDDTCQVAEAFKGQGVRYLRVDHLNPLLSRRVGFLETSGRYVCCLDADDYLSESYLEAGRAVFDGDYRIGMVYSDVEQTGETAERKTYGQDSLEMDITLGNFIHSGAIFLREAAMATAAFEQTCDENGYEDLMVWRRMLQAGYWAVKQPALYYYYRHPQSRARGNPWQGNHSYFQRYQLRRETLTLCVLFSSSRRLQECTLNYLSCQTWPHSQIELVLINTDADPKARQRIGEWMQMSDYSDVCYVEQFSQISLREGEAFDEVCYGELPHWMRTVAEGAQRSYVWVLQDGVMPPEEAAEWMLRAFNYQVHSVSIPLILHPQQGGHHPPGRVAEHLACTMIRAHTFRRVMARWMNGPVYSAQTFFQGFDKAECRQQTEEVMCLMRATHSGCDVLGRPLTPQNFDEALYREQYPDVDAGILQNLWSSGFEHYQRYGEAQGRRALCQLQYFDEPHYLSFHADVCQAVEAGELPSGLAHFRQTGFREGRLAIFY